jgi:hypothetical protein
MTAADESKGADVGEKRTEAYRLSVCGWNGNPRHCVYLNSHRVAGGKPWGGADQQKDWDVTLDDLADAIPAIAAMRKALEQIAAGDGVYGAQAYEYKEIARAALAKATTPGGAS